MCQAKCVHFVGLADGLTSYSRQSLPLVSDMPAMIVETSLKCIKQRSH